MKRILIVIGCALAATLGGAALVSAHGGVTRAAAAHPAKVALRSTSLGRILVDRNGRTLYLFEKDRNGRSACSGACAQAWPPLLTSGRPVAGHGVSRSKLGTVRRASGRRQVTYAGHPLYRYAGDGRAGDTNGEGSRAFGAAWYALSASGHRVTGGGSAGGY
jgi:predicted lipoprotein with Yx(FWY)xxD motif